MRRLTLTLILLLAACGGDDGRTPVQTTGTIVFIGDSITQQWPLAKYVTGAENVGISGNETAQMLDRFDTDVLARKPALVVIHGGINDIRNHESSDCSSLVAMVQKAQAANIKVVVGTLMLAENLGADADAKKLLIRTMNDEIHVAAESYGFEVVDYYKASESAAGKLVRSRFPDGLHPNRKGYDAMFDLLLPVLRKENLVREGSAG